MTEAHDGVEALERMRQDRHYDLVISDIFMPKMGGEELIKVIKAQNPSTKTILITGFPNLALIEQFEDTHVLIKPFDLERMVRIALDVVGVAD